MTKSWLMLAMLALAAVMSLSAARADDDARARKMMEEAFNRRYRWSEGFKGFSADFSFTREGKTVKGTIKADATKPHGGVTVECDDADVKKLVSDTVASTVTHTRAPASRRHSARARSRSPAKGATAAPRLPSRAMASSRTSRSRTATSSRITAAMARCRARSRSSRSSGWPTSGKTLPRAYAFTIKNGDREQSGKNMEIVARDRRRLAAHPVAPGAE